MTYNHNISWYPGAHVSYWYGTFVVVVVVVLVDDEDDMVLILLIDFILSLSIHTVNKNFFYQNSMFFY